MGNKSKNGRTTKPKVRDLSEVAGVPGGAPEGGPQPISVDPQKVISVLRAKLEASEHRNTILDIALSDAKQEIAEMRQQFDEMVAALPQEEVTAPKKKSKEK